jgi:hypothetical protein
MPMSGRCSGQLSDLIAAVAGVIQAGRDWLYRSRAPPVWAGRALPGTVAAVGMAARWPNGTAGTSIPGWAWSTPTGLSGLQGWPLINVLTRGRHPGRLLWRDPQSGSLQKVRPQHRPRPGQDPTRDAEDPVGRRAPSR